MECPKCHKKGNVIRRVFAKKDKSKTKYCMHCGAEVVIEYNWMKIFIMAFFVLIFLILFNLFLQYVVGWPGLGSVGAASLGAVIIALFMRRPPYTIVRLINTKNNPKKNKKHNIIH
jgi:hypothetical protein